MIGTCMYYAHVNFCMLSTHFSFIFELYQQSQYFGHNFFKKVRGWDKLYGLLKGVCVKKNCTRKDENY